MNSLNSHLFLTSLECGRKAWLAQRDPSGQQLKGRRLDDGQKLLKLAQTAYTQGKRPAQEEAPLDQRTRETEALLASQSVSVVLDGWFESGVLSCRTDILLRAKDGWVLQSVKASGSIKGRQIDELAFKAGIMMELGFPVVRCEIVCVNKGFVYQGAEPRPHEILRSEDVTNQALRQAPVALRTAKRNHSILKRPGPPEVVRRTACRECSRQAECYGGALPDHDVIFLPGFKRDLAESLADIGVVDVREIPLLFPLSESQKKHRAKSLMAAVKVLPGLKDHLESIRLPALYVDFEVDQPAFPWVMGGTPYEAVPFQHHWEKEVAPGILGEPGGYLWPVDDPGTEDPRPGFVATLMAAARQCETILVYSDFERRAVAQLEAQGIPGARELGDEFDRKMVDLLVVVKEGLEHPGFLGGHSVKTVLPALCPEMKNAYSSLAVRDGDMAVDAFRVLQDPRTSPELRQSTSQALREYCALDVRAMVHIVWALRGLLAGSPTGPR